MAAWDEESTALHRGLPEEDFDAWNAFVAERQRSKAEILARFTTRPEPGPFSCGSPSDYHVELEDCSVRGDKAVIRLRTGRPLSTLYEFRMKLTRAGWRVTRRVALLSSGPMRTEF